MEYSKEDLMKQKQIWGVGENKEQRKVKNLGGERTILG